MKNIKIVTFRPAPDNTIGSEPIYQSTSNKKRRGYLYNLFGNKKIINRAVLVDKDVSIKQFDNPKFYGILRSRALQASVHGMTTWELIKSLFKRIFRRIE